MLKQWFEHRSRPLICTPLTGQNSAELHAELAVLLPLAPDVLEWRADYFTALDQPAKVLSMAHSLKQQAGNLPVIFTIRSEREGGQPILLTEPRVFELLNAVCSQTPLDIVDCELSSPAALIRQLQTTAHQHSTAVIGSFHNFHATPDVKSLLEIFHQAELHGLDAAKAAVMPRNTRDVLTLLQATLQAKNELHIPLITMSMGALGSVSRLVGGLFGSTLTFATGCQASAPGQIPIGELQTVLDILEKHSSPR
ncbi:MAG TPA: type I 3-dehydroquinate dehydratase [Patescibacteria group bacterium]|nr:type I 3-dehydroquinate dehydratase [Patescibacteria group bacterium]